MLTLSRLHEAVTTVCPIVGVSVGTIGRSETVTIHFAPGADDDQKAAARTVVAGFDWSAQEPTRITSLAFYDRFTDAEQVAIELASRANDATGAMLALWMKKAAAAGFVRLDGAMRARLETLAALGLLDQQRVDEIMG